MCTQHTCMAWDLLSHALCPHNACMQGLESCAKHLEGFYGIRIISFKCTLLWKQDLLSDAVRIQHKMTCLPSIMCKDDRFLSV